MKAPLQLAALAALLAFAALAEASTATRPDPASAIDKSATQPLGDAINPQPLPPRDSRKGPRNQ